MSSPGQFSLRLQPILEVITEQSAAGAVDLVSTVQEFLDLRGLADCILAEDRPMRFNCFCDFIVWKHVRKAFLSDSLLPLSQDRIRAMGGLPVPWPAPQFCKRRWPRARR